jgi:hypothetical protein
MNTTGFVKYAGALLALAIMFGVRRPSTSSG